MIHNLENKVNEMYNISSDINEHIPTIVRYGQECNTIIEMGVRSIVSTWGWLGCAPEKLTCYDIHDPSRWGADIKSVYETAEAYDIEFEFIQANVLEIEIPETDLLFIDTWHTYDQLKAELEIHSKNVKKYICFHDTTSYEFTNESSMHENVWEGDTSNRGIWPAIEEFLEDNKEWKLKERFKNNNGFTIIERIKP